jgi:hypothetical protein
MENQKMEEDFKHSEVVAIRQAFYEGLGRICLNKAWSHLNIFRENQDSFLGKPAPTRGVSQRRIAMAIDRNTGEVCRWLQGKSPQWTNLMMLMLVLDAYWNNLNGMPTKLERKLGGYSHALQLIRRRLLGDIMKMSGLPSAADLRHLEMLFNHPQWEAARRIPTRRGQILTTLAKEQGVEESIVDATDNDWGDAFSILQRAYMHSIDVAIWH